MLDCQGGPVISWVIMLVCHKTIKSDAIISIQQLYDTNATYHAQFCLHSGSDSAKVTTDIYIIMIMFATKF